MSGIDLTGHPSDIASLIPTSTDVIGEQEQLQAVFANLQDMIVETQAQGSSMPAYDLVTEATNALFTNADQGLLNADAALLASDQLLAGAVSSGAGFTDLDTLQSAAAILGVAGADLGALGTSSTPRSPFPGVVLGVLTSAQINLRSSPSSTRLRIRGSR